MDVGSLFMSFSGRINRAKFWLGVVILTVINFVISFAVALLMGNSTVGTIITGIIGILIFIASLAVGAKRCHDRAKSGWLLLLFYVVPGILMVIAAVMGLYGAVGGSTSSGLVAAVLGIAAFAICIWAFVELGCLRGTIGPNQYGPDPLPPGA
jgi:uncharacterized membrane protein YhaH (DUF805 family)